MGQGSHNEFGSTSSPTRWFLFIAICAQIPGILAFILIAVLFGQYCGGFGWGANLTQVFNYHPLFMTLGMVFLYGDAILVYRVFYDVKKLRVKILHACLLALALIFSSIGLKAVFDSHNRSVPPLPNLTSLHSWTGLTTVTLFGLQWVGGFVCFLLPGMKENIRAAYLPSHNLWGRIIFILATGTVLMGISEYGVYHKFFVDNALVSQRVIINLCGICVMIFANMVLYLVGNPGFQRPVEIEAEHVPFVE